MLFRPNFCANCGERIERAEWPIWVSRRFCQVCESQFKGWDLIPRAVVVAGLLIGLVGVGSYLKSGDGPTDARTLRTPRKIAEQVTAADTVPMVRQSGPAAGPQPAERHIAAPAESPQPPAPRPIPKTQPTAAEAVYYCGAETKKGTPCSRRVKGNVRCYQHQGMPAMAGVDPLRIK